MIHVSEFKVSPGLEKELEAFQSQPDHLRDEFFSLRTREEMAAWVEARAEYRDLTRLAASWPPSKVLDVGCGYGVTAAYLAHRGHDVTAVEPSHAQCQILEQQLKKFSLSATIIVSTGEAMAPPANTFDHVVFCSSLHHCDDPLLGVKQAARALKPGGRVYLIEPVLKFYRSKEWFYWMLEINPGKIGHYGGNEHIYRCGEYAQFLKDAGLKNVEIKPSAVYSGQPQRAPWDNPARFALKKAVYSASKLFLGNPLFRPLTSLLLRLSLLNPVLIATK